MYSFTCDIWAFEYFLVCDHFFNPNKPGTVQKTAVINPEPVKPWLWSLVWYGTIKDISKDTRASMAGTSNQFSMKDSLTETKFSKN